MTTTLPKRGRDTTFSCRARDRDSRLGEVGWIGIGGRWRNEAKCLGTDPTDWETASLKSPAGRAAQAREMCAGCPVLTACAQNVYDNPDTTGVVAAGLAIAGESSTPDSVRKALAEILGVEYVSAATALKERRKTEDQERNTPSPCSDCGHPTLTDAAFRHDLVEEIQQRHGLKLRPRLRCGTLCAACNKRHRMAAKKLNATSHQRSLTSLSTQTVPASHNWAQSEAS